MPMTPKYDKSPFAPQWEYRQPTWDMFLTIREWAQEVANIEGYPLYLVGSALVRMYPRDIDICMIMPLADFEGRYGKLPTASNADAEWEKLKGYLDTGGYTDRDFNHESAPYTMTLDSRIRYAQRIDFKFSPDTWFRDRDKLLLAEPSGHVMVRDWGMPHR